MIKIGKEYMIFKPKENVNNGEREVSFSIGHNEYNKGTKTYTQNRFARITAKTNQFLSDRDKIIISKIISVNPTIYYDKDTDEPIASGFFIVELEGEKKESETNYESTDSDELPF